MRLAISIFICTLVFLIGVVGIVLLNDVCSIDHYKRGQIDYHNGIVKYHRVIQPDSSVVWEEIKTGGK